MSLIPILLISLLAAVANAMSIEYVAGQRCLWTPAQKPSSNPPLVVLGGMAQSIASWEHHVPALSKDRDVLLYEARGQGPPRMNVPLEDQFHDVSLPAQADCLVEALDELEISDPVDIAGFSLGGRIAMATGIRHPTRIRKLHLTGVAANRSPLGRLTVASWKDHVQNNSNLRSFAWSVLLATYSPEFLANWQAQGKLEGILDFVATQNSKDGLTALLEQAHAQEGEWSTAEMAQRVKVPGRACVGSLDKDMAPVSEVETLCQILDWEAPTILEGCGHAAPMEQPRLWRNGVLEFLNE